MEKAFADLAAALRERRQIIGDSASRTDAQRHVARLKTISEKIEAFASQLPMPVHPQLAHFLQRASYDKALAFLEER